MIIIDIAGDIMMRYVDAMLSDAIILLMPPLVKYSRPPLRRRIQRL